MKENSQIKKTEARTLNVNTKTSNQASLSEILQAYKNKTGTILKDNSFKIEEPNQPFQMKAESGIIQLGGGKKGKKQPAKRSTTQRVDPLLIGFLDRWEESGSLMLGAFRVIQAESYPMFEFRGKIYHITTSGTFHVSDETSTDRKKYFFKGTGSDIKSCRPEGSEKGQSSEMFNKLPDEVQGFIKDNWSTLFRKPSNSSGDETDEDSADIVTDDEVTDDDITDDDITDDVT